MLKIGHGKERKGRYDFVAGKKIASMKDRVRLWGTTSQLRAKRGTMENNLWPALVRRKNSRRLCGTVLGIYRLEIGNGRNGTEDKLN